MKSRFDDWYKFKAILEKPLADGEQRIVYARTNKVGRIVKRGGRLWLYANQRNTGARGIITVM
jgi:hypothetical protein